jgi:hypothetical protein
VAQLSTLDHIRARNLFMTSEHILNPELVAVAESLEKEFRLLGVHHRKIPLAEWDCLPSEARKQIPPWLVTLLSSYSLLCPFLNVGEKFSEWGEVFSFWPPSVYLNGFSDSMYVDHIIKPGFIPLADTSDGSGNLWLTSITGDSSSPLYLFGLSGADRRLVCNNLSELLMNCKVDKDFWRKH